MSYIKYEVRVYADGTKEWFLNGKRHREDGPAIECADGYKAWYLNNERHREDGPAVEWAGGSKEWYLNDKRHREDGPAIEYADGSKEYWIHGKQYTEKDFNKEINTKDCEGQFVTINGVEYVLKRKG